jgi:FixJ family two-component response regulator
MLSEVHTLLAKNENKASTVYIVDDDEAMRRSLGDLLESVGLRVETFESSQAFLAFPKRDVPSCLILDVRLREENGLAFQQEATRLGLCMPILFMTGYGDMRMSVRAMKAGAIDFLPKPFHDQDMLDAVFHALRLDRARLEKEQECAELRSAYEALTLREQQVMACVVSGLMNKQIAAEINLSEITVKVHRGQVMKKMNARTVPDLVRKADALQIKPHRTGQT